MKRSGAPLFIVLLATVFFWRVFLLGECPFFGDAVDQFLPWKMFAREELLHGRLPLWNPYHFAGAPFLADMQSAVLYPVDLLLLPFPPERAFGLSLWLHTILAGAAAYLLARGFRVSRAVALLAGIAYMLNGFFMIHIFAGNLLTAYAAAWIPLMLLLGKCVGEGVRSPDPARQLLRTLLWGGPVAALQILCGHPQMTFYSFFFATVLAVFSAGFRRKGPWQRLRAPLGALGGILAILLLGLALAGPQVVPTLEYAFHSSRSAPLSFDEATQFTFSPDRMIEFLIPEFFGTRFRDPAGQVQDTYWSPLWRALVFEGKWVPNWKNWSSVYFGSFAFLLALYGLFHRREDPAPEGDSRWPLRTLALLALFLSFGPHTPVFRLFFFIPGFHHFRAPSKFTPYMIAALCVFAGMGLDRVRDRLGRREVGRMPGRGIGVAIGIVAVLALIGFVLRSATPPLKTGVTIGEWVARVSSRALLFLGSGGIVLLGFRKRVITPAIGLTAVLVLHSAELFWMGTKYPTLGRADWSRIRAIRDSAAQMGAFREPYGRVMVDASLGPPEAWSLVGIEAISGYDPLQVGDYVAYVAEAEGWERTRFRDSVVPTRIGAPEYDLLNVAYAFSGEPIRPDPGSGIRVLGSAPGLWILGRDPFPRAFWVPRDKVIPAPPYRLLNPDKSAARSHQAEFRRISPGDIEVRVTAPEDGYLFLSEVYYPGWQAVGTSVAGDGSVGTSRLEIRKVDDLFRLVPVSAGRRTIRLRYRPASLTIGIVAAGGALAVWVMVLWRYRRTAHAAATARSL